MPSAPPLAAGLEFYEASAQIVPLLFLVLLVERRVMGSGEGSTVDASSVSDFAIVCAIALSLVAAEVVALGVLLTGDPSELAADAIAVALALAGFFLAALALLAASDASVAAVAPEARPFVRVVAGVTAIALTVVFLGVVLLVALR